MLGALLVFDSPIISSQSPDPFAFLAPTVYLSQSDRQRIERGDTIVNTLPPRGRDVAMVAVTLTTMTPERLVAWAGDIERLKAVPTVHRVRRLSAQPALEEFAALSLPDDDIRDLRNCRPGKCEVKLTAAEMTELRREMQLAGPQWMARANAVFREIAHDRVVSYLAGGHAALDSYVDGHGEPSRAASFTSVLANSPFLQRVPQLAALLVRPAPPPDGVESFTYWSVEDFGVKAVAGATETIITTSSDPTSPAVMVAGKQIFATHYSSASLNLTSLVRRNGPGAPYYLVVVNRSTIDTVEGFFGGFVRRTIEGRVRRETGAMITSLRKRIEAGPPRE
ncbi:MAG: hypothetical protein EPO35_10525 [Acidobacteria bacterium]|nr:MAG: hypothetical protein EPO35_10525 [Acidobacteriota bacterium]